VSEANRFPEETSPEIERLLSQANLLRAKGQLEEALHLCQQAIEQDEKAWAAWELLGDLEHERTNFDAALEAYQKAHTLNPDRAALEEKIGVVVLEKEKWERRLERMRYLETHPEEQAKLHKEMRNPALAAVLSGLIPGLGQIYNRQVEKGIILVVIHVVLLSVVLVILIGVAQAIRDLPSSAGSFLARFTQALQSRPLHQLVGLLISLVALLGLLTYALLDALLQAVKINQALEEGEIPE
jgi:tetratricopeptide (TPR) repeat protein